MSKRTNKRTNRNKKNYRKKKTKNRRVNNYKLNKLNKRTRCLNKKYIGGEGKMKDKNINKLYVLI